MARTSDLVGVDPVDCATACRRPKEFGAVYRDHFPRVFGFVISRVRNDDLAQEITADVFARAYERWGQLRDRSAVTWWLFRIARNCVAAYYRGRKRESSRQARLESLAGDGFSDDCPVAAVERSYDVEQLRHFLRQLSRADQELISLRFDAALTAAEIANVLGISQQNVRVRIFRAMRRLRELMISQEATTQGTASPIGAWGQTGR